MNRPFPLRETQAGPRNPEPRRNHAGALSLLAATAGFGVLEVLRHAGVPPFVGQSLLQSGFEAGMVGGCADWFAVSALFHPIPTRRFRLPGTDIIVHNRRKLSRGIVDMVQNRWLSPATLAEHLDRLRASAFLLERMASPGARTRAVSALRNLLGRLAGSLDAPGIAAFLDRALRDQLAGLDLAPAAGRWLEARIAAGDTGALWDFLAETLARSAERGDFQGPIRQMLERAVGHYKERGVLSWLKGVAGEMLLDYEEVSGSLGAAFARSLRTLREDPAHPLRARLDEQLSRFARRLAQGDPGASATLARFQRRLTEEAELGPLLARILSRLQETLKGQFAQAEGDLSRMLEGLLGRLLDELRGEPETRGRLDAWVRRAVLDVATRNHHVIGEMVESALAKLSDRDLVSQIEDKVGADLQYIRLNGAVVGGIVGVAIAGLKLVLGP